MIRLVVGFFGSAIAIGVVVGLLIVQAKRDNAAPAPAPARAGDIAVEQRFVDAQFRVVLGSAIRVEDEWTLKIKLGCLDGMPRTFVVDEAARVPQLVARKRTASYGPAELPRPFPAQPTPDEVVRFKLCS